MVPVPVDNIEVDGSVVWLCIQKLPVYYPSLPLPMHVNNQWPIGSLQEKNCELACKSFLVWELILPHI